MKSIFSSGLLVLSLLLILSEVSNGAVQCGTVTVKAAQCVGFATGKSPKPAAACCTGLQELAQIVKSVDDKRAACQCLRNSAKNLGIVDRYLTQLPALCKINVGFPVSTTTNCQSIH